MTERFDMTERKKRGGRVLRFAVGGALLASAPALAACSSSHENDMVNEPLHVNEPEMTEDTVNEPNEPDHVNEVAPPIEQHDTNEVAPESEESEEE